MGETEADDGPLVTAAQAGGEAAFTRIVERHQRELRIHCYATNACLDFLDRHPRQPLSREAAQANEPPGVSPPAEIQWLQPYPDRLLEPTTSGDAEPEAAAVGRETIELAFLAAIQHLPPRQRAALILRDVLGWSAKETAAVLESSVASVKSALQRARPTLRTHLPEQRLRWAPSASATAEQRDLLRRLMDAHERADAAAFAELLSENVQLTMPPLPFWFSGREAVTAFAANAFAPDSPQYQGHWRCLPTGANRQPAMAGYIRLPVFPMLFHRTGAEVVLSTFGGGEVRALRVKPDVAITIDAASTPPMALLIRGRASVTDADGIVPDMRWPSIATPGRSRVPPTWRRSTTPARTAP